jgi:CDP-diacylglycerol--glycerol-3-phosphate 3-phosphatidyltransferase
MLASEVLNERLRPVIEPFTTGTGKILARAHVSPNGLTTVGLAGMLACSWLVADGRTFLAGLWLIPAFLVDVFDGALARATGRVTAWGGFYDSVCDRIADGALFGAFVWLYRRGPDRVLVAAIAASVVTQLVPYARAKAEALGYRAPGGLGERAERAILVCAGLILGFTELALWLVVATTAATFVRRVTAVRGQAMTR